MERLSLPRRNYQAVEADKSPPKCRAELPKDPLPTWVTLPMDAKLPMLSGPKKSVMLYTTNVGEKIHMSFPELDFDLSDPYSLTMSNDYKPLHDPHLKLHLDTDHMKRRLYQGGFITRDGKVVCTLKEYNEYRQYLRKINLLLDKKSRAQEKTSPKKAGDGRARDRKLKGKEDNVKSLRERLEKQCNEEREKYIRLFAEEEERRQKAREEHISRMSEREQQLREEHERRQAFVMKKQEQDRKKKMELLRTWLAEDKERCNLAEKRKAQRAQEHQKRLALSWEERRKLQSQRLEQEQRIRREAEVIKQRRLKERELMINRQRRRQQAIFERMTRRQREEREKLEAEYARNITARLERRKKRARLRKLKGKKGKITPKLRSNWNTTELLLQEFSDGDVKPRSASELPEEIIVEKVESRRVVSDMQMPREEVLEESLGEVKERLTAGGIPTPARITEGLKELIKGKTQMDEPPDADNLASALIFTNNYLASEVMYPALSRYNEETGVKQKKSIRFAVDVQEMPFISFDYSDEAFDLEDLERDTGDESDDEDDEILTGTSTLISAVDSLTKVRRLSVDQSPLAGLADILCRILERLERGELSQEKAAKLSAVARDILFDSLAGDGRGSPSSDLSQTSLIQQSSSTSLVAAEVVKISMDKVQQELLKYSAENEFQDFYEWPLEKNTSSELSGMSKFVAETAIAMAVESLMSCMDDILDRQKGSSSDSQLFTKGAKRKGAATASDSILEASASTESVSCTSEFIINILNKIVEQVKEEHKLSVPVKLSAKKSGQRSETSIYILETLQRVVSQVQAELAAMSPKLLLNQPRSKTSLFVMDTLERVVTEIQRSRSPSATSLFIDDLLSKTSKEVMTEKPSLSWHKSYNVHSKRDNASVTSLFIRNTLSKVLHEIEDDFRQQSSVSPSITSLFADQIVKATLRKCSSAVCQEMLPSPKLSELTAAIISSQQKNEHSSHPHIVARDQAVPIKHADISRSFGEFSDNRGVASVDLAESLIKTTLEKAKESLSSGSISAQQVVQVLSRMNASSGSLTAIDVEGKVIPATLCSPEQASSFLTCTIDQTLQDIDNDLRDRSVVPSGSKVQGGEEIKDSDITNLVQSILEKAIKELNQGLADESSIEKMGIDIRQSVEDDIAEAFADNSDEVKQPVKENNNLESDDHGGEFDNDQEVELDNVEAENNAFEPVDDVFSDDDFIEEVELHPVYKGEELTLDSKIVSKALMAISVKKLDDMEDLKDPLQRNSFRSLIRPDITDLSGVDTSNTSSVKSDLVRASMGALPSQTKFRIKTASKLAQASKKSVATIPSTLDDPTEKATQEKSKLKESKSLTITGKSPSRSDSQKSSSASPSSSPKSSKGKIIRASLAGASAPAFMMASRKRSPTKLSSTNVRDVTPRGSRQTLSSKKGSDTATHSTSKSPSHSSRKSADSKFPSSSSVGKRLSASEVKPLNSATRKSVEAIEKKESSPEIVNETSGNVEESVAETSGEEKKIKEGASAAALAGGPQAEVHLQDPEDEEPETPPEEIEVSQRPSKTVKACPRESGPIEMVTSTNPPSIKKSSETSTGLKSKSSDVTSPPGSHRAIDLAPRPSSGFKKSSSSYTRARRSSQESVGGKDGRQGSVHSLSSGKDVSHLTDQPQATSSDSKIDPEKC